MSSEGNTDLNSHNGWTRNNGIYHNGTHNNTNEMNEKVKPMMDLIGQMAIELEHIGQVQMHLDADVAQLTKIANGQISDSVFRFKQLLDLFRAQLSSFASEIAGQNHLVQAQVQVQAQSVANNEEVLRVHEDLDSVLEILSEFHLQADEKLEQFLGDQGRHVAGSATCL
ncbi:hypothetical protein BGZ83_009904 [Gryganskiella cystojenkinii]|nr:hypothetical protein BGZ83_009904 [Gryganskiella cystojenkinii]